MVYTPDLNAVADAVMAAHAVIEEHGTREMKAMSQVLLFAVGKEIAQRSGFSLGRLELREATGSAPAGHERALFPRPSS